MSKNSGIGVMDQLKELKKRMDVLYSQSLDSDRSSKIEDQEHSPEEWRPPVDIFESDDEYMILADLPGVLEEDLQVELKEKLLIIRGRRNTDMCRGKLSVCQSERPAGHFERSFSLPEKSRSEGIVAEFSRGVLRISVSKSMPAD